MYNKTISNDKINKLPIIRFEGEIEVIESAEQVEKAIQEIKMQKLVGFDTETKPSFKKGVINDVSLIQISTLDKAYLFRLNKIGFTSELANLLSDNDIVKIGCSIRDDIFMLNKIGNFSPTNFIDLQEIISDYGIEELSLKKITAIILEKKLSKRQRLSNWEAKELKPAQMSYAATDAWVCIKIYTILKDI